MKKGQGLPINTMILIILGLIVLGALIWVFQTQIRKGIAGYEQVGEQGKITADKCANLILQRSCADSCPDNYKAVPTPPSGWKDTGGCTTCCEPA